MARKANHGTDPTSVYARAVVSGEIMTGRLARLACERHLNDLRDGTARGLRFDLEAAAHAIEFFSFLRLIEGENADRVFKLEPFQEFIVGSLFGWKGEDGYRRFRTAYVEIGKGNGKSPLAAGIGLYGLSCDKEQGAEVYAAAVTRDQAKIVFTDAEKMAKASPFLSAILTFNVSNLALLSANSYLRPVSSEARALDGKRVHMALIDEIHEHPNAMVVDKMRAGTKARRQSLIFEITNSGYDRNSVCWNHHEYSSKILQGVLENDSWFAYVCQLDPCEKCAADGKDAPNEDCGDCDDWRNESTWIKANPGLDVILPRKYLREQVEEALGMPSKQNIVRRLNFCQWTEQAVRWIPMADWDACPSGERRLVTLESLRRRPCYCGLDLSSKIDLAAFVKVFAPDETDPCWVWLCRFFVPGDNVRERERRDRVPYSSWINQGFIEATEGNVVDYNVIEERIVEDSKSFSVQEIGFDPWNATQLATDLIGKGFKMVETRQGTATMNEPSKEFEAVIRAGKLDHRSNPVLRWNASNVAVHRDRNDNLIPDKERSSERIDGIVAGLIAMARAIRNAPAKKWTGEVLYL